MPGLELDLLANCTPDLHLEDIQLKSLGASPGQQVQGQQPTSLSDDGTHRKPPVSEFRFSRVQGLGQGLVPGACLGSVH